jgi:hypothetical protein
MGAPGKKVVLLFFFRIYRADAREAPRVSF